MPWQTFRAWSERRRTRDIERRNEQARAAWRAAGDELKRRGG